MQMAEASIHRKHLEHAAGKCVCPPLPSRLFRPFPQSTWKRLRASSINWLTISLDSATFAQPVPILSGARQVCRTPPPPFGCALTEPKAIGATRPGNALIAAAAVGACLAAEEAYALRGASRGGRWGYPLLAMQD